MDEKQFEWLNNKDSTGACAEYDYTCMTESLMQGLCSEQMESSSEKKTLVMDKAHIEQTCY